MITHLRLAQIGRAATWHLVSDAYTRPTTRCHRAIGLLSRIEGPVPVEQLEGWLAARQERLCASCRAHLQGRSAPGGRPRKAETMRPYPLRLPPDLAAHADRHGGAAYIRDLLDREMILEQIL